MQLQLIKTTLQFLTEKTRQAHPSPEIKDISSPLTIISGISYYTPEQ